MIEIIKSFYQHPLLTNDDMEQIAQAHELVEMGKGTIFLEDGKLSNEYYLLESGLVRAFVFDYDGKEITTEFFTDNDIVIIPVSLFLRSASQENLQALTDCVMWKIDFNAFQHLFHNIKGFTEWGRAWFAQQLFVVKQRSLDMVRETATTRYLKLLEHKPAIVQHAPLKQIASFLGITDTSLSRIRKEISE